MLVKLQDSSRLRSEWRSDSRFRLTPLRPKLSLVCFVSHGTIKGSRGLEGIDGLERGVEGSEGFGGNEVDCSASLKQEVEPKNIHLKISG